MKRNTNPPPKAGEPHPLETLYAEVSLEPAEPVDRADEDRGRAFARNLRIETSVRLAHLRRQLTPDRAVKRQLAGVSPELQALARSDLLLRLESLRRMPEIRFNHLKASELSDDDLRQLIAELENVERSQS